VVPLALSGLRLRRRQHALDQFVLECRHIVEAITDAHDHQVQAGHDEAVVLAKARGNRAPAIGALRRPGRLVRLDHAQVIEQQAADRRELLDIAHDDFETAPRPFVCQLNGDQSERAPE
jgi:hypothetical protein